MTCHRRQIEVELEWAVDYWAGSDIVVAVEVVVVAVVVVAAAVVVVAEPLLVQLLHQAELRT